jgi:hypothetical protein
MTIQDTRNSVRSDAEARALKASIERMAREVEAEVNVSSRHSSRGSVGALVGDPRAQYAGQPRLGAQYLPPEVQSTPAVPETPRPLSKRDRCAMTCNCGLTICRIYGDTRN